MEALSLCRKEKQCFYTQKVSAFEMGRKSSFKKDNWKAYVCLNLELGPYSSIRKLYLHYIKRSYGIYLNLGI